MQYLCNTYLTMFHFFSSLTKTNTKVQQKIDICKLFINLVQISTKIRINICIIVDVGVVEVREMKDGKQQKVQYEVDFIATNGQEKYYVQSAYRMDDEFKREQELNSLKRIDDSSRKIVIVGDDIAPWTDEKGISYIGLFQFLKEGLPK